MRELVLGMMLLLLIMGYMSGYNAGYNNAYEFVKNEGVKLRIVSCPSCNKENE